jgi:hypothetical protein
MSVFGSVASLMLSSIDMYNNDVGQELQPYIYEAKMHSNERHPIFYYMSFLNPYSPLTPSGSARKSSVLAPCERMQINIIGP